MARATGGAAKGGVAKGGYLEHLPTVAKPTYALAHAKLPSYRLAGRSATSPRKPRQGTRMHAGGVCATDMFAHVQTLSNPNAVVDLAAVPSPEDGSLAQVSKSVRR